MNGQNISCGLLDELADHPNALLYNVFVSSSAGRRQPLTISITTAGSVRECIAFEVRNRAAQALEGSSPTEAEAFFAFICEMDDGDDWQNEATWIKSNPSIDVLVPRENIRTLLQSALAIPSSKRDFLRYNMNIWATTSVCGFVNFEDLAAQGCAYVTDDEKALSVPKRIELALSRHLPKPSGDLSKLTMEQLIERVRNERTTRPFAGLDAALVSDLSTVCLLYRPKRTAHQAVARVERAIVQCMTRVIDIDLRAYFDNVQHALLMEKVARRIQDDAVMKLLKMILKSTGKKGVPQGGVVSPLLSNVYLNEVDRMLEKAIATTRRGKYTNVQYARYADDLVILVDGNRRHDWLVRAVERRLREELAKLRVEVNEEKSRTIDLAKGECFSFLGFEYRYVLSRNKVWRPQLVPKLKKRTALLAKLREIFQQHVSQPVARVVARINPILRGWVNYFAAGHSSRCFAFVRDWIDKKIRRHLMRARKREGCGWKRMDGRELCRQLGLFDDYRVRQPLFPTQALRSATVS